MMNMVAMLTLLLMFSHSVRVDAIEATKLMQCGWPCDSDDQCNNMFNPPCPSCVNGHCASSFEIPQCGFPCQQDWQCNNLIGSCSTCVNGTCSDSLSVNPSVTNKSFMLFAGSPFGFWGGPYNESALRDFMSKINDIYDLVDTVSVPSYFLQDPTKIRPGGSGLVRAQNADVVTAALQKGGFRVVPLVGDFYGQNNIERYRYYMSEGRDNFIEACADEVGRMKLDGLNFDFEPSAASCAAHSCGEADARLFAGFLDMAEGNLSAIGAHASVDTGQSVLAKTQFLNQSTVSMLVTMNTYYDLDAYKIALPRDIRNDGPHRFSLGVCPGCYNSTASDVRARIDLALEYGVRNIAYWAGGDIPGIWLRELRRWKASQ